MAPQQGYISQEATKTPQPKVHITVDRFSKYEIVAQTSADLEHRGLRKIGFVSKRFALAEFLRCGGGVSAAKHFGQLDLRPTPQSAGRPE
jgi:hypothetical protein